MSRIICIIGAHGCGKSTAALKLAYDIKSTNTKLEVKLDQESIKEYVGFKTIEDIRSDNEFMYSWSIKKFHSLVNNAQYYDIVISDRSPLDSLFYTDTMDKRYANHIIEYTKLLHNLELILIKVPTVPIEDNGFRGLDSRELIYNRAKKVLDDNGFSYRELLRDDIVGSNI